MLRLIITVITLIMSVVSREIYVNYTGGKVKKILKKLIHVTYSLCCQVRLATVKERFKLKQVLDGGVSTELASTHGYPEIFDSPLWSSELLSTDPKIIKTVHDSFLTAGSDIIGTITYQASIEGFVKKFDISKDDAFNLIKKGAELATEARDEYWKKNEGKCLQTDKPLVAGALGPYGAYLNDGSEYTGNYMDKVTEKILVEFHQPRVAALVAGGVDLISFETVPAKEEAIIFAELLAKYFPDIPAWVTFQCKDEVHVGCGQTFKECVESLLKFDQILGIGINCTSPQYIEPLLKLLPDNVKHEKTIVVYSNSGLKWNAEKKNWYSDESCPYVPDFVAAWMKAGALWIGGCCRITPKHITEIRTNMNQGCQKPGF